MEDDDNSLQESLKWLKAMVQGAIGQELETRAVEGLRIIKATKGFIRSSFIVPSSVSVRNLNQLPLAVSFISFLFIKF